MPASDQGRGQRADQAPRSPRQTLGDRAHRPARRSRLDALLRLAETQRLADAFQRAGVPVVQLKGAPLSERLYGDALLRHSMDIDVLASPCY